MCNKKKKYVSQPSENNLGYYEIAKYSDKDSDYVSLSEKQRCTEEYAKQLAQELNEEDSDNNRNDIQ